MTSVGYDEVIPRIGLENLLEPCARYTGVLVLSLPIPIHCWKFEAFHKNQQKKDKAEKSKKKIEPHQDRRVWE